MINRHLLEVEFNLEKRSQLIELAVWIQGFDQFFKGQVLMAESTFHGLLDLR